MAKNSITEFSETPSQNTDIGGISLLETASPRNIVDYVPELMSQLANMNKGTAPLDDTFTIRDPADTTKQGRHDAENIPTGTVRVIDVEAEYQMLLRGATPRLITAYTSNGTHTFNTATKYFQIIAVGAGGGSGGVDGGSSAGASTAGGNSGFYGRSAFFAKSALVSGTVVVGAGGTAGGTSTDGGDGGDTTWTDATNGTLTWKGGKGSGALTASSSYRYGIPLANAASSGSLVGAYDPGGAGLSNGTTNAGGIGGSNPWGTGGIPSALANASAVDGVAGTGYGAGASGAASNDVTTNPPGAAGTVGRLEVWEF